MYTVTSCLLFLLSASVVACSCPKEDFHHYGACVYKIKCINSVKGAKLAEECQGSSNSDVIVDLTLSNVDTSFHVDVTDTDFLTSITSLTVFGTWPQTNLTFLEFTLKLKKLQLVNLQMKQIHGRPFQYLSSLETINLSQNHLSEIDDLFVFMDSNKVKKLYLSHNKISEVTGYVFQELTSLVELDLSNNMIEDLNEEPFSNLTSLETLRLNNNFITYLNGAINKKLLSLKRLYLGDNNITYIDDKTVDKIYHLETFDLSNNKLTDLSPKLFIRHWDHFIGYIICRIVYSGNRLTVIRDANSEVHTQISNKNHIDFTTKIDLSNNIIKDIQYNAFKSVINMIYLDISNNKLNDFVVNSEHLSNVKFLNISGNFISSLDSQTFSHMNHLLNLDLSNNHFEYLPDKSLIYMNQLKSLNFTQNDIQDVVNFHVTFHSEGGILDMSQNSLSSFIISPGEAEGLIELILHSNNITDPSLIKLNHHSSLMKLDMSKNLISFLTESSLQLPVTLVYLDLSSNIIQNIRPSAFFSVKHLHTLRLSHNYLKNIEYGVFRGLTSILNLDLAFNRISSLDSKVLLDLKSLRFLSIRHNQMTRLDCKAWIGHKTEVVVYIDGNSLSCEWLGTVLTDFNNGYSKMRPTVINNDIVGHSIEGIPCILGPENLDRGAEYVITDERLLATSQKILEAVREQTAYLRKYIWRSVLLEANRTNYRQAVRI